MVAALERLGDLGPWRDALLKVPRHLFVPERAWCTPDDSPGYLIDRERDPAAWLEAAYTDMAIVTQLDDGATDVATGQGEYSSSLSAPSVIVAGLSLLNAQPGDRVLEIGTGTGWTAGLLSSRVGQDNLSSIEIDPQLADQAAKNLKAAGWRPHLVTGDGALGWLSGGPYERVHVTCGVREVPYVWVEQTRPGGVIILPLMASDSSGQLTRLVVQHDGSAVGQFYGEVNFMMLRAQRAGADQKPEVAESGLTVTPEGQRVWLDSPDNPISL
jgi:protein-L-isoaspartate(D-aspartate) O-methyltransferase